MDLINSFRSLGKEILEGSLYDSSEMESKLDEVLIAIDELRNKYDEIDLPEAEGVLLLFFEALDLYEEAIETIISCDNTQEEHIAEGLMKAEEATDILCHVEDLIGESKETFDDVGSG